ncbi:MAG: LysM peptidoglycan-binding domain-containing protein [Deltaproteobacteria bacterium]|nr:LysM peptidoglycan-binding domain-containing protein [Deltaproteobacteria bacterium]
MKKLSILAAALAFWVSAAARAADDEGARLARLAGKLKPIADSQWNEIAGPHASETYDVQKGDTLWDVSKRLFGNGRYWPKVWSLNNAGGITNPHVLTPGEKLVFRPGSSEAPPSVTTAEEAPESAAPVASAADTPTEKIPEYEKVSPDLWKPIDVKSSAPKKDYDEFGLEKNIKIFPTVRITIRVPAIANETTLPDLGEITGSRRDGSGLSQDDVVFVKSDSQDLQVGNSYMILSEPIFVDDRKSDRNGYIYRASGEVRIVGVKDNLYIGIITKAYDAIHRGNRLYPLLPIVNDIQPIAAAEAIEAMVLLNPQESSRGTSQFHFIHLDRGIEDGIQPGNVVRLYEYYDPVTREKITDSDIMLKADAMVVHATGQYSTAMILRANGVIHQGDLGVLITDVSELRKQKESRAKLLGEPQAKGADSELDDLDALESATTFDAAGKKEEQEIKELENWDKNRGQEPTTESPAEEAPAEPEPESAKPPESSPVEPEPAAPQSSTPEPAAPEPAAPEPVAPEPVAPEPATSQPPAATEAAPNAAPAAPSMSTEAPPAATPSEPPPPVEMLPQEGVPTTESP